MPIINVKHASPLSAEQIDQLIASITEVYVSITNATASSVQVLIDQTPAERWGIGGQSLANRNK
ncbi:tautomerase family protein [Gordonia humi]|uniref:4-oxalocrotonate tautomerase n=1 Tax=Gordonia humi TaxID=686429 RepID=A0A840EYG4_9ACTN|nr:tautomerase family protein [Gordonia humi]MBB4138125.1 4-oxalocrotonate tautomerase [Gordonia humi]